MLSLFQFLIYFVYVITLNASATNSRGFLDFMVLYYAATNRYKYGFDIVDGNIVDGNMQINKQKLNRLKNELKHNFLLDFDKAGVTGGRLPFIIENDKLKFVPGGSAQSSGEEVQKIMTKMDNTPKGSQAIKDFMDSDYVKNEKYWFGCKFDEKGEVTKGIISERFDGALNGIKQNHKVPDNISKMAYDSRNIDLQSRLEVREEIQNFAERMKKSTASKPQDKFLDAFKQSNQDLLKKAGISEKIGSEANLKAAIEAQRDSTYRHLKIRNIYYNIRNSEKISFETIIPSDTGYGKVNVSKKIC